MPKVLIVGSAELGSDLERTILWGDGIERALVSTASGALEVARAFVPSVVVVDGVDVPSAVGLLRRLPEKAGARRPSVVGVSPPAGLPIEELLRGRGQPLVTGPPGPPPRHTRLRGP